MKKIFIVYSMALFFVLLFIAYFLLNPLKFSETNSAIALREEHQSKYEWEKILAESTNKPPENLYTALEKGNISFCDTESGISPELCRKIFLSAQEKCSEGKPIERIFCVAFLDKKRELCKLISLKWYALTCDAIIDGNAVECLAIGSLENRALCLRDLASNLKGLDCTSLQPGWQNFCIAFQDSNSSKCDLIKSTEIKSQCLALFNI